MTHVTIYAYQDVAPLQKASQDKTQALENCIKLPDVILSEYWTSTNWEAAEELLKSYQRNLALAAANYNWQEIKYWQRTITDSIEIKKLAVRKVLETNPSPGIDGVRWQTPAQMMQGALDLKAESYRAVPIRHFMHYDAKKGKRRIYGVAALKDRCMHLLYAYALGPVAESLADHKSFAFRKGRSQLDVHYYIKEVLTGKKAPEWIIIADVKSFYDSINHEWLLSHIPMRKMFSRNS